MQEHPTAVELSVEVVSPHGAPIPEPRGDRISPRAGSWRNDSGTGITAVLPDELKGFNWSAFLLNWIWSLGHNTWIGLLAIVVPFPIMQIILGIKGNEWAWQNRRWDSVEQFRATERAWLMWGLGLLALSVILFVGLFALLIWVGIASGGLNSLPTNPPEPTFR